MNKLLLLSCVTLFGYSIVQADGEIAKATIQPSKVAYVRLEKIMPMDTMESGSREWRDGIKKITDYVSNEAAKIKADYDKYAKLADNVEQSKKLMDQETLHRKQRELEDLQNKIQRDDADLKQIRAKQAQDLQMKMYEKIQKTTGDFAEKQGWDLVMLGGALYVNKRIDITDEILALLNKEYDAQKAKETTASKTIPAKPALKK